MNSKYQLVRLPQEENRGGTLFGLVIRRNFATNLEPSGSSVFWFMNESDARLCLDSLND